MKLQDYKKKYDELTIKKNLTGKEALETVKQNGYALRYVNNQTEQICLEAIRQNGYALRYVNSDIFRKEQEKEITTKKDLDNTVGEIGVIMERIYKRRPDLRPKEDRPFNEDAIDNLYENENEK